MLAITTPASDIAPAFWPTLFMHAFARFGLGLKGLSVDEEVGSIAGASEP